MERWRERVETSQAHRQTLNPIAWAGSRKRIASDRGGGGGGGGKRLFSFFFSSLPLLFLQHGSQQSMRAPNAAAVA